MTKALQLARLFKARGFRVILAETKKYRLTAHRFSLAVDEFVVIPSPREGQEIYTEGLVAAVKDAQADIFLPVASPLASVYDAKAHEALSAHCQVLHWDARRAEILDDKEQFCRQAAEYNLPSPKVFRITDRQQLETFPFQEHANPFILKSIPYDSVTRLDLRTLPHENLSERLDQLEINEEHPWVLQEFVRGREYCTHGTMIDGTLSLYCCCASSPFQVNYQHEDLPKIEAWVTQFAERFGGTGQASFDFIVTNDGEVRPIECNPRTHSAITAFHANSEAANAYLKAPADAPLKPPADHRPTYWIAHEVWRFLKNPVGGFSTFLQRLTQEKEAVWSLNDPLPFFMLHHIHIPFLLWEALIKGKDWVRIDFNIGKLVEPGGD